MKILHVLSKFLPAQTAGTEVYTWALSKNLKKLGYDVKVVIPNYHIDKNETYSYDDIEVTKFSETSIVDRSLIMGFRPSGGLISFIELIKKEDPDVVHFHELAGSNGITIKHVEAVKQLGIKVVMTFHLAGYTCKTGTMVRNGSTLCDGLIDAEICGACHLKSIGQHKSASALLAISGVFAKIHINPLNWKHRIGTAAGTKQLINKLETDFQKLIENCDRVVVLTNWYNNVLIKNGVDEYKISHIPQGLPVSSGLQPKDFSILNGPLKLMFLGRISPFKGLHLLIDSLKDIDKTLVSLSIFGCSNDEDYEKKLRHETKNFENVLWCGELEQSAVISKMREHDILCLCSTFSEMSPLVIQEAFAAGIPVIASRVHGNVEQIKHGFNGLLFDFNDSDSLKEQIQSIITDPNLLVRLCANIQPPNSFENVAAEYAKLYQNL